VKQVQVTLVSGRTMKQGIGLEEGKQSEGYIQSVRTVMLCPEDASALGLADGQPVKVSTGHGDVVVHWAPDKNLGKGMAFFPYGPWANQVYTSSTDGTGMPLLKGIEATIAPAEDERVLSLGEIVESLKGGL
jgi:formylmethanofuran dehydrogenase subunit D